ncbi:dihydrofolate reductase family protein [soil metagenome]
MGTLVYTGIISLDGYLNDPHGRFDWAAPSEEVHAFVNELERGTGTYLYGRRMYDTMTYWETTMTDTDDSPITADFQRIWRAARKVVYSTSLDAVATEDTTIERVFDPDAVADLVGRADTDVSIGGAHLAAQALRAELVGEIRMLLVPVIVGGGTAFLPEGLRLELELRDERRFANGTVYLRYAVA